MAALLPIGQPHSPIGTPLRVISNPIGSPHRPIGRPYRSVGRSPRVQPEVVVDELHVMGIQPVIGDLLQEIGELGGGGNEVRALRPYNGPIMSP